MFDYIYKKIVIDFSKVTLFLIFISVLFAFYQAKNFNLDASSDALLLEGDPDLKYLREINETYGSKDFLVLTYSPITSFTEKETILNIQLLKSKIEKLTWVDSVITIIDVPLLKSTDENLMERLKNYKTLAYPEIDRERGFEEIINSPIYKNYVISEDGKTSGIVVYLKKDERLTEYIKIKDKFYNQSPSRSGQLNKGASHASGDYLIFLHADTYINEIGIEEILHIEDDFNWGFLRIKLDDSQLKYKVLSHCINLRSKIFSYSTGDQVLIIKKDLFYSIKGYHDINLMEDIEITHRLKKMCKPYLFSGNAISSARRWKKNGFLKTILQMRLLRVLYHLGVCTNKLNKMYK